MPIVSQRFPGGEFLIAQNEIARGAINRGSNCRCNGGMRIPMELWYEVRWLSIDDVKGEGNG